MLWFECPWIYFSSSLSVKLVNILFKSYPSQVDCLAANGRIWMPQALKHPHLIHFVNSNHPSSAWNLYKKGRYPLFQYWSSKGKRNRLPKYKGVKKFERFSSNLPERSTNDPVWMPQTLKLLYNVLILELWQFKFQKFLIQIWINSEFTKVRLLSQFAPKNFSWLLIIAVNIYLSSLSVQVTNFYFKSYSSLNWFSNIIGLRDCESESRCSMDECLKSYSELKFDTHSSDQQVWLQTLLGSLDN